MQVFQGVSISLGVLASFYVLITHWKVEEQGKDGLRFLGSPSQTSFAPFRSLNAIRGGSQTGDTNTSYDAMFLYQRTGLERRFDLIDVVVRTATGVTTKGRHTREYGKRLFGIATEAYNGSKTKFMYKNVLEWPHPISNMCEIGFNVGHSATLMLEAVPTAKMWSFDLGLRPRERIAKDMMQKVYGNRFHYIKGDSLKTIPRFRSAHPEFSCDIFLVDGMKSLEGRKADVENVCKMVSKHSILFFDEVNSQDCAAGNVSLSDDLCQGNTWEGSAHAYNILSKSGVIQVLQCAEALQYDLICSAVCTR